MISDNDLVKLIFGFKIRHLRLAKKISYQEMSAETGIAISYLNDIEKGKKYPKPDKINALARVLDVSYDELVSTRADKKLQPVIELLNSEFFKFFPLHEFGISLEKLLDVFSNSPERFSAIISTVLKIARSYQIEKEHFYRIALRSFQDIHDNYFPELEEEARAFRSKYRPAKTQYSVAELTSLLQSLFGIKVDRTTLSGNEKLQVFRSYYHEKKRIFFLNKGLTDAQELFLLSRELGFQHLNIHERPFETTLNKEASFEKLLGNFRASYFASALLMEAEEVVDDLKVVARAADWSPELIANLMRKYQVTPETLLQRFTNILPHFFGIKDLFFIRLKGTEDLISYDITKELHLSRLHTPYHTELAEHLCHRWVSISSIKHIRSSTHDYFVDAQISDYWQSENSYFCMTIAQPSGSYNEGASSVTIGLLMSDSLRATFNFIKDPRVKRRTVHTTCERCSMPDCENRVAPAKRVMQQNLQAEYEAELKKL